MFSGLVRLMVGVAILGMASASWAVPMIFDNMTQIDIPATGTLGAAGPYPSSIEVSGLSQVTDVNVSLLGLFHTWPDDIYVVLEGPTNLAIVLWSDAGGGDDVSNIDVTFDDEAAGPIPNTGPVGTGSYQVSQIGFAKTLPGPAPSPGFGPDLSAFDGLNPNGTWH